MVVSITMLPLVHSNDGFTQLEEVWLGDVYPHEFYDHLAPDVRDVFYRITDMTREDLQEIQTALESFGVRVHRPIYRSIENHIMDDRGNLAKPDICPRDIYLAVGTDLVLPRWVEQSREHGCWPWAHAVESYENDSGSRVRYHDLSININGANIVRVGRDLFIDCVFFKQQHQDPPSVFASEIVPFFPDRRCHYLDNGGHLDGCFAVLRPGLILANNYFQDYDRTFPGWQQLIRSKPEFHLDQNRQGPWSNGKWYLPGGLGNRAFNDHVIKHAQDWVGNYTETYFEINCLVINPEHVFMLGNHPAMFDYLKGLGMTAHSLPFRCRTFWDGGLHCLTVDIRRQGGAIDYFANPS